MPDGHQIPKSKSRNHDHDDPFNRIEEEISEKNSFARNPYKPPPSLEDDWEYDPRWEAWRAGWQEAMRFYNEREAAKIRKPKK